MTTNARGPVVTLWNAALDTARAGVAVLGWVAEHVLLVLTLTAVLLVAVEYVLVRLAGKVARSRARFRLTPSGRFDPDAEQIWRQATLLSRAALATPWWVPRRARTVRIRLRADGTRPLDYLLEGPITARHLLASSPYKAVQIAKTGLPREKTRTHTVRVEFVLRGHPARRLREVPLVPDPLQPLADAVATIRTDLGDTAEICLDLQPVPRWRLLLRRQDLLTDARTQARRDAAATWKDTREAEDSWRYHLSHLLRSTDHGRDLIVPPRPRPLDRAKALGRLAEPTGLLRIQILVRCTSNATGRAEQRLQHIATALETFTGGNRLSPTGRRIGPFTLWTDSRFTRRAFDRRWTSGQITGRHSSWARADEIAGLLKPPTLHCRLPLLAHELPVYVPGATGLMPHGWYTMPEGTDRLIATPLGETFFSLRVGKSGFGKTEQAITQAIALAHAGEGFAFVDPHGDALKRADAYLAHPHIAHRMWYLDLAGARGDRTLMGTWNSLGLERGQRAEEVVRATCDAFATVLGWNDSSAPRALTIFGKAVEALVTVNATAVALGRPHSQATLFQIPTLLTDALWRTQVIMRLPKEQAVWWLTMFPHVPADALPTVLNPIERLHGNRVARAFLGSPVSTYNIRHAMDEGLIVWISPSASGPTDRLLVSLLFQDLFRAGLSRRDLLENRRRHFHAFVDELISIDSASTSVLASISEELRKFGIRLHAMTQLLQRVSTATRDSLMQNASVLSSTAGAIDAVSVIAKEWGAVVDPVEIAELPRYEHYITLTVAGRRLGPLRIRGPELNEVFAPLARPRNVGLLRKAAYSNVRASPLTTLHARAAGHADAVASFLHSGPASYVEGNEDSQDLEAIDGPVTPQIT